MGPRHLVRTEVAVSPSQRDARLGRYRGCPRSALPGPRSECRPSCGPCIAAQTARLLERQDPGRARGCRSADDPTLEHMRAALHQVLRWARGSSAFAACVRRIQHLGEARRLSIDLLETVARRGDRCNRACLAPARHAKHCQFPRALVFGVIRRRALRTRRRSRTDADGAGPETCCRSGHQTARSYGGPS